MSKTILITGSTDGIGLEAAKLLLAKGHTVLLHGRNPSKLERVANSLSGLGTTESYIADLSDLSATRSMAEKIAQSHSTLDVLINNAGVYSLPNAKTPDGLNTVFKVNTVAPYLLTQTLLPIMPSNGRVINLSSAAQSPVNLNALTGNVTLSDPFTTYAQSKLALTMWSIALGQSHKESGPAIIAVNPGSMLGTKMVQNAFGVAGGDVGIGADILARAAVSDEFKSASGKYYDNDARRFNSPHPDALNSSKSQEMVRTIESILAK
ncbi:MAG: SDR family NAD(P)-dependent oxidoreductase [Chloroflexota bacterium]